MDTLHVATFNILNLADRWAERLPLILADMAALQPDLLGLQEVVYVMQQDRLIGAAGEGRYGATRGWAGRPEYGNSLLVREPLTATSDDRIDLGFGRAAHRVVVALPSRRLGPRGRDPSPPRRGRRGPAGCPGGDAARLAGQSPGRGCGASSWAISTLTRASRPTPGWWVRDSGPPMPTRNGADPAITWPSGLQAPAMDTDGDPDCLDYIWVSGAIRVVSARLVFDRPDPEDPTLYPSDHFGVAARLEIGQAR